ncbi:endothelin-converting enzyme 2-like isoform X2 [Dermacentor albipictus]|uniref:endothelin-converting enzyme 2-like isoform X2 n=1 Tax=Dermacentor albipictus TaxID=60249 RepID=UPI0031FD829F
MATDQKKLPNSRDASTIPPRSHQSQDGSKKKKKKQRRLKRDDQVSHPSCLAQESTTPSQQSSTASVSSSATLTPVVSVSPKTTDWTPSASGSESVSTAACEPAWLVPKEGADVATVNVSSPLQQKSATEGKSAASARELVDPRPAAKPERLQSEPSFGATAPPGAHPWSLRSSSRVWGGSLFDLSPSTKMDETTLVIGSRASAPELLDTWSASPWMEPRSCGVASKDSATAPYPMRQSFSATTSRPARITMPSWLFPRVRGRETPGGSSVPSAMPPLTGQRPYGVGTESGGARSNLQVPYTPTLMSTGASTHPKNAESRIAGRKDNRSLSFCQLDGDRDVRQLPDAVVADPSVGVTSNKTVVIAAGFGLFWVSFIVVLLLLWEHRLVEHSRDPMCRTEDCVRHAELLANIIATSSVDPCEDFAAYVCSSPSAAGLVSSDNHHASAMDAAIYSWYSGLGEMLHVGSASVPFGRKPLEMYESCSEGVSGLDSDPVEFLRFVNEAGLSWPDEPSKGADALSVFVSHAFYYEAPAWFSVAISESTNRSDWRLVFSPSRHLPGMLEQHERVFRSGSPVRHYRNTFRAIGGGDVGPWNEELINEMATMERDVLWKLFGAVSSPRKASALISLEEFDNYTPSISCSSWLRALRQSLPLRPTLATEVYLTDVTYIKTVGELFAKYDDQRLLRHLSWLFVQRYAAVVNVSVLVDGYMDYEAAKAARHQFCGFNVEVSYNLLLSVLYFVLRISNFDKASIDATFDSLTAAARHLVIKSSWLDSESKCVAAEKLRAVKMGIWPNKALLKPKTLETIYGDFPEDQGSFTAYWTETRRKLREAKQDVLYHRFANRPMNAAEPYLTYEAIANSVLIATGAVAKPLYYSNGTKGMMYGGIGFLMMLEIVKSLDISGLRWHPNGSVVDSILSEASMEKFDIRDSCRVGGENVSVFPEVPALEVAYSALQEALTRDRRRFRISENITEERAFFLTLCLMTCRRKRLVSTARADCNKAVRYFRLFAKAFSCPLGSNMNPRTKCKFFA